MRGYGFRRALGFAGVLLAVAGITGAITAVATASDDAKPFTAAISPTTVGAGSPATLVYTISNPSTNSQRLGSANITIPAGWTVSSTSAAGPSGKSWSATLGTGVVQVRAASQTDRLAAGESVAVSIVTTAPCALGSSSWGVVAKQANNFSGSGNDFYLKGAVPAVGVVAGSVASFSVGAVSSPQTAGVQFTAPVTALDTCGNVVNGYNGTPSLSALADSPNHTAAYESLGAFTNGVATLTVTDYRATLGSPTEAKHQVTITAGAATGATNLYDVSPGQLGSFSVGAVSSPQTAGVQFTVPVTAFDLWGNQKTDYNNPSPGTSGLPDAPAAGPGPSGPQALYTWGQWSNGVSTLSVTAYKAGTGESFTVSDTGKSGSSNAFDVNPGQLASFGVVGPSSPQTAGVQFTAAVTAYDPWRNVKTDYNSPPAAPVLSTLAKSPGGTAALESVSLAAGVGTLTVTDYRATTGYPTEAKHVVTITDGSAVGTTAPYDVSTGALTPAFTAQPVAAQQKGSPISSSTTTAVPVAVTLKDDWGNLAADGTSVTMTAPSSLGGTNPRTTTAGVASFGDLTIGTDGTYHLTARVDAAPNRTVDSSTFVVADSVAGCTSSCSGGVTTTQQTSNTNVTNTTAGQQLVTTLVSTPPGSLCSGFSPFAGTAGIDVVLSGAGSGKPSFTVTLSYTRSVLGTLRQLSSYNVCLGAVATNGWNFGWRTKSGAIATWDAGTGLFWGIVPNGPYSCDAKDVTEDVNFENTQETNRDECGPYISSRAFTYDSSHNVTGLVITMISPWPWDQRSYGG